MKIARKSRIVFFLFLVACALQATGSAQQVHIDVEAPGFARLKVAMPPFAGDPATAQSLWKVCARDLAITGLFDVIDPASYVNPAPAPRIALQSLKDYALIGADYAVAAMVTIQDGAVRVRFHMVEVSTATVVDDTLYTASAGEPHRAVHAFLGSQLESDLLGRRRGISRTTTTPPPRTGPPSLGTRRR
ncbi:MAG TPA: hypothetical protein PLT69_00805, partial [Deltaproteobacteria bacterium]|nr:hypothetical protein [Deltaproteobacteria bacterium]